MPPKYEQYEALASSYEKHPDQGLKACKKKLQRDPSNVVYLLAQAHFLQRLARENDALASCEAIKTSVKEPLETSLIVAIQGITAACQHSVSTFSHVAGSNISALWKDALDGISKQSAREVQGDMLRAALDDEYWDLAQQLFARLQKENVKSPQFHFAWVALSELQAHKMPSGEKTGQSLQMLAYRSLKAAVENTIAKKDVPRKITSAKELRLVAQVYRQQKYYDELLDILDNPEIGIDSDVGKNDVEFIRVKMDMLSKQQQWERLTDLCLSSLEKLCAHREDSRASVESTPGNIAWADDWHIWQSMIVASSHLSSSEKLEPILAVIKRFLATSPKSRNAGRASLLYDSYHNLPSLLTGCMSFLVTHKQSRSCFEDLRSFLEMLDGKQQEEFSRHVKVSQSSRDEAGLKEKELIAIITSEVNSLKIQYLLSISKSEASEHTQFISDCLNIYHLSADLSDDSGDEACILAVMALLISEQKSSSDDRRLIQTACLLENLRDDSPDNSKATLLSLLISQLLGLGSISLAALHDLSLREIQYDTLSHLLYTRISVTHPFGVNLRKLQALDVRHKDPFEGVNFALKWKPRAVNAFLNFMTKDVEQTQFDKMLEFSQFKERLEKSFTRRLLQVEKRRLARLTDRTSEMEEPLAHFKTASSDNRDYYSIPDFEYTGQRRFAETILTGNKPGMFWLAVQTRNDILQSMLLWKVPAPASQIIILSEAVAYLTEHATQEKEELTASELGVSEGWELLQNLVTFLILGPSTAGASKDPKKDFTSAISWLQKSRPKAEERSHILPHWTVLQAFLLRLELLKAYGNFVSTALTLTKQKTHHSSGKLPTDGLQRTKKVVKEEADAIQVEVKGWKKKLERDGVQDVMKAFIGTGAIDEAIEKVVRTDRMVKYAREFVESGIEALDGIIKVRV